MISQFFAPAGVFLLTLASGIWLSRSGKPLNTAIFTLHKLIALAGVVIAALQTHSALMSIEAQFLIIALIGLIGLCVMALFVTGALMSMNKPAYSVLLTIHNVAPFVVVIAVALTVYFLTGRR